MYSLMHLRCLVFKSHKIIGQRSFQICTGVKIKNCPDFYETYLKLFRINTKIRKRIVLYISDADLLTYDPLGACRPTGSFIHKLYE